MVAVAVRVKPGSSRTRVGGSYPGPYGPALVVAVNAPAVDGRATEAARRALADALGLRPAALLLRSGAASRDKLFTVQEPPPDLAELLQRLHDSAV
jgi:uncharacterized protein YggU (UPF0235/DUF167 family)